jgi:hypothetical protein
MNEKATIRSYRVLTPVPPSSTDFEAGDERLRYLALGDYDAADPDAAVEAAADDTDGDGGILIAIPISHWQQREAQAKTMRIWEITKTPALPAGPPEPEE